MGRSPVESAADVRHSLAIPLAPCKIHVGPRRSRAIPAPRPQKRIPQSKRAPQSKRLDHSVHGRNPVLECLRAKRRKVHRLHVQSGATGLELIREAAEGIPVVEHARGDLDRMTRDAVHQGVLLEADPLPIIDLKEWLATASKDAICVILDGVEDPHNFGAIVRSASALGAEGVIFAKDRAAPVTPTSIKAAAGAMEHMPLIEVTNIARAMDELKKENTWIAALDPDGDQTLWEADLSGRLGLVIGAEGKGIRRLVLEKSDFHLRIPLTGPIPSLNASVSAAVALAAVQMKRG